MEGSVVGLGIMSGTSLDGLDLALCRFNEDMEKGWQYSIESAKTVPYSQLLKEKLATAIHQSAFEFVALDVELGKFIGREVNSFLQDIHFSPHYIASHGHTVFHQPDQGITAQIGNGAVITALTGITTIADFRTLDVALGGQGAPLVPIGDALLFKEYGACLNLGGFSNVSYQCAEKRVAFDISPCNLPLNLLARQLGYEFDTDGEIASSGLLHEALLERLNALPFYSAESPKSLGLEWLKASFYPILESSKLSVEDKMRTVSEHIACQIAKELDKVPGLNVLATGGGVKNRFLRERIQKLTRKKLIIPNEKIIDYKEALIFAFLGLRRLKELDNCYASVTGATCDSCGGSIYFGRK